LSGQPNFFLNEKIAVLRIRDVYTGSKIGMFPFRIPDPGSKRFRVPDPNHPKRNLNILNPKAVSKLSEIFSGMFIQDPVFFPSQIPAPDPVFRGQKKHKKNTGSRIPDPDPQHWKLAFDILSSFRTKN
jgi:hypothetical protein